MVQVRQQRLWLRRVLRCNSAEGVEEQHGDQRQQHPRRQERNLQGIFAHRRILQHRQESDDPRCGSRHSSERRADQHLKQQQRADRLNYVAIVVGVLIALYVVVTIIRPLFSSTRPGQVTKDFGCISKSTVSDCTASSR